MQLGEYDNIGIGAQGTMMSRFFERVALGFIVIMVKDMREQMRGAAYTALKEVDSDDVIPYFEDGLSRWVGTGSCSCRRGTRPIRGGEEIDEIARGDRGSSRISKGARGESARSNRETQESCR